MTYTAIKFELLAKIDGNFVDIVQCSCSYELNRIPKATLVLPVGREATTMALSYSHTLAAKIAVQIPAQIYVNVIKGAGFGNAHAIVPEGVYLLFDGYVTGVGYRRKTDSLSIAIGLTHWLSDLNFSSTLSASSHPGNPYTMTFNASSSGPGDIVDYGTGGGILPPATGGTAKPKHWIGKTMAQSMAKAEDVKEDFLSLFFLL